MTKIKVYVGAQFDWYEVFLNTRIGKYPSNTHYTLFVVSISKLKRKR